MTRLFGPEPIPAHDGGFSQAVDVSAPPEVETTPEEFELVVGRRQVAGLSFLILTLIAAFSGASYLLGKSVLRKAEAAKPVAVPLTIPAALPEATIATPPLIPTPPPEEAPLFAEPVPQAIYIQLGAVEKGVAVIFAEGLRKRGFDGFVASGPTDKVFRVLVGPFPDAQAYQKAKDGVDAIGLSNFARRYQTGK